MTTYSSKSNANRAAKGFMELVSKLNIGGTAVVDGNVVTFTLDHSVHSEYVALVTKRFPDVVVAPAPVVGWTEVETDCDNQYRPGSKRAKIYEMLNWADGVTVSEAAVVLGIDLTTVPRQRIMNRFFESSRNTGRPLLRDSKRDGEKVYRLG